MVPAATKNLLQEKHHYQGDGNGNMMYAVGEKVLAYHGPRVYAANIQRAEIRNNEWNYFVHYLDSSESSDEWVGIDRLMKYTEENIVKQRALDEKQGVDTNPKSGSSTKTKREVLNDVKVEKENEKSSGAKGKKKEGDLSIREDEDCPTPDSIDFISQMPDDVLVKILSCLPLKHAVTTGILSTRWRFVWSCLKNLSFDGTKTLAKMNDELFALERAKYINQVNSVIRNHRNPTVHVFQIYSDLDKTSFKDIDNWLRWAFDKKVELLELNLCENRHKARDTKENYDFPLFLSNGSMLHLSEWLSSNSMGFETLPLKKVMLLRVNVSELALNGLLKNSPHLESLLIYGSGLLTHVNVGGRDLNLKRFALLDCLELQSVSLYDFDLEKFQYIGPDIEIRLTNLPKIKKLDIGEVSVGLNNKVFSAISSVASSLEVLSLEIDRRLEDLKFDAIPKLPNVKTLKLTLSTELRDGLTDFIDIAKACPILENLIFSLYWCSPSPREKVWYSVIGHSFKHLKRLEIHGYRGLISDFQIALYMIGNAAGTLKKIVIDPSCHPNDEAVLTANESMKRKDAGRSQAQSELSECIPSWIELVIL